MRILCKLEFHDTMLVKIYQHLEKLQQLNKGVPISWNTVYILMFKLFQN